MNIADEHMASHFAEEPIAPMDELSIAWRGSDGVLHWLTPREAIRILRRFYDEWPGGLEEFEAEIKAREKHGKNGACDAD